MCNPDVIIIKNRDAVAPQNNYDNCDFINI